jgi:hypothetical protein
MVNGGNQNDDGATHGLHDTLASLHRSLKKAESIIKQESEDAGYSITHFEIDFPAELGIGPESSGAERIGGDENGGVKRAAAAKAAPEQSHAFLTLPRTRALRSKGPIDPKRGFGDTGRELPDSTIPKHHLSRLKVVLRKEISLEDDTADE